MVTNASITADVLEGNQRRQDVLGDRVGVRSVMEVRVPYQLCYRLMLATLFCDVYDLDNLRQAFLNRRKRGY